MRMPTRYSRADTHSTAQMLTSMIEMDAANCQAGGISDPIRSIMMIGAVAGNSDAAIEMMEFGLFTTITINAKLSQIGTAASGVYICSSCSVSHDAASPANSDAYSRYPSTKYTGKSTPSASVR